MFEGKSCYTIVKTHRRIQQNIKKTKAGKSKQQANKITKNTTNTKKNYTKKHINQIIKSTEIATHQKYCNNKKTSRWTRHITQT